MLSWETTDSFVTWEQLLARIAENEPQLHGALADMGLAALADGEIVLVCPADQLHHISLVQQYRGLLEELAHRHLGAPFKVVLKEGEPELLTQPSLTQAQEQRRLELQRKVDAEAREHPSIRALLDSFEGELRVVKPLRSS